MISIALKTKYFAVDVDFEIVPSFKSCTWGLAGPATSLVHFSMVSGHF